ncbi:hypothetical protein ALC57_12774, partial [Trachymyrmex cornetzi]
VEKNVCVKTETRKGAGTTGRLLRTLTSDWSRAKGDPHRTNDSDSDGDGDVDNRRDARLPRSHTVLRIMPHCRKRSSSTRPEGRSGNGWQRQRRLGHQRIPADTTKRNVVAKHGVVTKDDERITTAKPGRSR